MKPTRATALSYAIDVLERSDWLLVDLLADAGEDTVQAADDVMAVLRELRDEALDVGPAPCKPGDPDCTPEDGPYCSSRSPVDDNGSAYGCTLAAGHGENWHVAGDGTQVCAVWKRASEPGALSTPGALAHLAARARRAELAKTNPGWRT